MATTILNDGITTSQQIPAAASLCAPNAVPTRDLLQLNCFDAYYETCCPMVACGLPVRITDNQRTFPASNGIANEAQNYRQISGFAETQGGATGYVFGASILQGKEWGRRYQKSQTQLYCALFSGGERAVTYGFIAENESTQIIEEGYAFALNAESTTGWRQYRFGNNMLDPGVDAYPLFIGNNTHGYAVRFANDTNSRGSQSSYNLSTNDLMSVYDWSRDNYAIINTDKQNLEEDLRDRNVPEAPFTPNEPTSIFHADTLNNNGATYLAHTSTFYAALRGQFPTS